MLPLFATLRAHKTSTAFLVIGLAALGMGGHRSVPVAVAQTANYPLHSGFPRTEPSARIDFVSPSVVDLTGNGSLEVLTADSKGCVYAWNSQGSPVPVSGFPICTGTNTRINGPLAIANLDGDSALEIVAGSRGTGNANGQRGRIYVWDGNTRSLQWSFEMEWLASYAGATSEIYSVALGNVTGNSQLEVLAGTNNNASNGGVPDVHIPRNVYALTASGSVLSGFPTYYKTAGIYGAIGTADLDRNGYAEVVAGRDHLYLHAYQAGGGQLSGWPVQTYYNPSQTVWGQHLYVEFTHNAPVMADLNNDGGDVETIIAGKVRLGTGSSLYSTVLVTKPNGARQGCWLTPPLGGPPLYTDFLPSMAPALGDLNGDGQLDIVVAGFDGVIRAFDRYATLLWSYNFAQGRKLFGSEPVIGDVTGDGQVDVVFGTYSPDNSANAYVGLVGLSAAGQLLSGFPLSLTQEGSAAGVRAAPTLADFDQDGLVEIVAASWGGSLYAWDTPAAYNSANLPWPTGRHDFQRTGYYPYTPPDQAAPGPSFSPALAPNLTSQVYLPLITRNYCT